MAPHTARRSTVAVSIDELAALGHQQRLGRLAGLADRLSAGHRVEIYEGPEPDPLAILAAFDDPEHFRRWAEEQGYL